MSFKNVDGVPLKGLLLKPDNFDPKKKYPMIVYIYERLSQGLHQFRNPGPGTSINPTYYVSNGYLVYMPDIVYTIGYPGQSALKCVLPGIQAVVDKGFVNEKRDRDSGTQLGRLSDRLHGDADQSFQSRGAGRAGGKHDERVQRHSLGHGLAATVSI